VADQLEAIREMLNSVATRCEDSLLRLHTTTISTPSMACSSCAQQEMIHQRETARKRVVLSHRDVELRGVTAGTDDPDPHLHFLRHGHVCDEAPGAARPSSSRRQLE
jgi:hypothetical protein